MCFYIIFCLVCACYKNTCLERGFSITESVIYMFRERVFYHGVCAQQALYSSSSSLCSFANGRSFIICFFGFKVSKGGGFPGVIHYSWDLQKSTFSVQRPKKENKISAKDFTFRESSNVQFANDTFYESLREPIVKYPVLLNSYLFAQITRAKERLVV